MDLNIEGMPTVDLADAGFALTLARSDDVNEPLLNGKGDPLIITVAGQDSRKYRDATRANLNARLQAPPGVARRNPTAEELEASGMRVLVKCTLSWSGFIDAEGNDVPCSPANVMDLYTKYPFLKDQVDAAVHDRARFTKKSPTN